MFCPNCGTGLPDGAAFCANCGNAITDPQAAVATAISDPNAGPPPVNLTPDASGPGGDTLLAMTKEHLGKDYRIEKELGRGGMAVVYAGYHEGLDRPVALKVLAEHLADNPEFRARFLREARIAARLHHPHLVRTYDVTELHGRPCIVMELLLPRTLEGQRLTRSEAAHVETDVAFAAKRTCIDMWLLSLRLRLTPSAHQADPDHAVQRSCGYVLSSRWCP